jgi:hypothetical protein
MKGLWQGWLPGGGGGGVGGGLVNGEKGLNKSHLLDVAEQ